MSQDEWVHWKINLAISAIVTNGPRKITARRDMAQMVKIQSFISSP